MSDYKPHPGAAAPPHSRAPATNAARPAEADPIAQRFELRGLLGQGGQGRVFRAWDRFTEREVALKLFTNKRQGDLWKTRKEIMALRLLNLPGVVRFLEDGVDGGRCYLAMELVDGQPFPGAAARQMIWDEIAPITIQTLEIIDKIHNAGLLHRDLKPENILVAKDQITIVDFGVSDQQTMTSSQPLAGTPEYLAPEQCGPGALGPGTDLYALGTMLYRLLSGQRPFPQEELLPLLHAKRTQAPAPLRARCPSVPAHVAEIVDAMLARELNDRPRSAAEVIAALRGPARAWEESAPPQILIPRDEHVEAALAQIDAGQGAILFGPSGVGKSTLLRQIGRRLEQRRAPIAYVTPAATPLECLRLAVDLGALASLPPAEAVEVALAELQRRQREGLILLVDDLDLLPAPLRARLEALADTGPLIATRRAGPGRALRPLTKDQLMTIFEGDERTLRQRSTGADLLWRRTAGSPRRIQAELKAWKARRCALERGDRVELVEEWIERLEAHLPLFLARVPLRDPSLRGLSEDALQLLGAAGLAWPACRGEVLRAALPVSDEAFDEALEELTTRDLLVPLDDSPRYVPTVSPEVAQLWDTQGRFALHQRLIGAMRPGEPGRLLHMLRFSSPQECLYELEACAIDLERRAEHGALFELFVIGMPTISAQVDDPKARDILTRWLTHVVSGNQTRHINIFLWEVGRLLERCPSLQPLHDLALACTLTRETGGERAQAALAQIQTEDPALESLRLALEVFALRRKPVEEQQRALDRYARWADQLTPPSQQTTQRVLQLKGMLAYRACDFSAAAESFEDNIDLSQPHEVPMALLNLQSALLELGDLHRAERTLRRLQEVLRDSRARYLLVRLRYFERALAYRRAQPLPVDEEFLACARSTQSILLESLAYSVDAAFAWRADQRERARELALAAADLWARSDNPEVVVLFQSLAVSCGAALDLERWRRLCQVRLERPRVLLQSLALVQGRVDRAHWPTGWEDTLPRWTQLTRRSSERFEILTRAEVEAALFHGQTLTGAS